MKTTLKFRNTEGQFCKENANHGFTVEHDICTVKVARKGQLEPRIGNDVEVTATVTPSGKHERFDTSVFGSYLCSCTGSWYYKSEIEYTFSAPTWREAFRKAKDRIDAELTKYDALVAEREKALQDAEF